MADVSRAFVCFKMKQNRYSKPAAFRVGFLGFFPGALEQIHLAATGGLRHSVGNTQKSSGCFAIAREEFFTPCAFQLRHKQRLTRLWVNSIHEPLHFD